MSKHLLFILILAVCTNVFAQQTKSISGVVYDSNTGEALIGVSVLEVGTDRKSTRLNSSHWNKSRMPSSA